MNKEYIWYLDDLKKIVGVLQQNINSIKVQGSQIQKNIDNYESTQLVKYKESLWEKIKRRFGLGRK